MSNKEIFSPDYYALLTDPNSNVIVNDIRFTKNILAFIDQKYEEYKGILKAALIKEQKYMGMDQAMADEIYNELLLIMDEKKEILKKNIIVLGHVSNISNKSTVRTAVLFYQNLKSIVSQQLDIAYSLITTRLKNLRDNYNG